MVQQRVRLDIPWLKGHRALRWLVEALGADNIYFVGGLVRNALLERGEPDDWDVATPLEPDVVADRLQALDITVVPTGLAHGTVTAVIAGKPIEITTFRKDVSTDGRRATVAFTTDIKKDARRRDFTMNAIYMRPDGRIIDPLSGTYDLRHGRVRFVGDAEQRIREDYLRIYRYFRFRARAGAEGRDGDVLATIARNLDGLAALSAERVRVELLKILATDPEALMTVLGEMHDCGVNPAGLLATSGLQALARQVRTHPLAAPSLLLPLVRLGVLVRAAGVQPPALQRALKLSKHQLALVSAVVQAPAGVDQRAVQTIAYYQGAEIAAVTLDTSTTMAGARPALVALLANWHPPKCPVMARDLMARGIEQGPALGKCLKALEKRWVDSGFVLKKADLLADLSC